MAQGEECCKAEKWCEFRIVAYWWRKLMSGHSKIFVHSFNGYCILYCFWWIMYCILWSTLSCTRILCCTKMVYYYLLLCKVTTNSTGTWVIVGIVWRLKGDRVNQNFLLQAFSFSSVKMLMECIVATSSSLMKWRDFSICLELFRSWMWSMIVIEGVYMCDKWCLHVL